MCNSYTYSYSFVFKTYIFFIAAYCSLSSQTGMCKGHFPSYYYNSTTQQCEHFIYGGCGGNKNRFTTYQSCLETCGKSCIKYRDTVMSLSHWGWHSGS